MLSEEVAHRLLRDLVNSFGGMQEEVGGGESGRRRGGGTGSVMQNKGIGHQPEPMEMALVKAHSAMLP